ncbi:hypothetical protein [Ideonella sp. A 288]|uniref:hypothetical protein n=1 Tax=Ideonella sp. A 288 TaxID=1962181 RepID=UPI001F3A71FC|nr:hypothetical protein [Ideonella sp. A 288]
MPSRPSLPLALRAGAAYFGLVFGAGFLLGMVRVPLLVPRLGVRTAELLEMPVMAGVIWLAAHFIVRHFALPPRNGVRLATGGVALALTLGAELAVGMLLMGQSFAALLAARDPVSGSVYLALLGVFAVMPRFIHPRPQ